MSSGKPSASWQRRKALGLNFGHCLRSDEFEQIRAKILDQTYSTFESALRLAGVGPSFAQLDQHRTPESENPEPGPRDIALTIKPSKPLNP